MIVAINRSRSWPRCQPTANDTETLTSIRNLPTRREDAINSTFLFPRARGALRRGSVPPSSRESSSNSTLMRQTKSHQWLTDNASTYGWDPLFFRPRPRSLDRPPPVLPVPPARGRARACTYRLPGGGETIYFRARRRGHVLDNSHENGFRDARRRRATHKHSSIIISNSSSKSSRKSDSNLRDTQ